MALVIAVLANRVFSVRCSGGSVSGHSDASPLQSDRVLALKGQFIIAQGKSVAPPWVGNDPKNEA